MDEVKRERRNQNARSETIHELPSFRDPWKRRQFALVPCEEIFEYYYGPDRMDKKPVQWRINRKDGEPFEVAAIYERWKSRKLGESLSHAMIWNATNHPIMSKFHQPATNTRWWSCRRKNIANG